MDGQSESLNRVLRCEMTAVNQQFIHVLALRAWGDEETAGRIMEVDYVDFPNAMRIIDHLVETGTPIVLEPDRFVPGTDYKGILMAEQAMERRLSAAIEKAVWADDRTRALISTANAPRDAYAAWLAERLDGESSDAAVATLDGTKTAGVIAHLIAMIEQSMVHAFVNWHRGDADNADAAWATSGAAMMHMTAFVRLYAAHRSIPAPGEIPTLQIADEPAEALDHDRQLARQCADEAAAASLKCKEAEIAGLCGRIAEDCRALSRWSPGETHPAAHSNPPAFSSFEATRDRFVRSR